MSVVFVTGGAGYVGSHSVKALAQAGYDVVVYDNLSAIQRIAAVVPGRSVTLVEGDILDGSRVREALQSSGASAVMHFAAILLVGESVREPYRYYRNNVAGTLTVLEAMATVQVKSFASVTP